MKSKKSKFTRKKKPSGAQYRKMRHEKMLAAMAANGLVPDVIQKPEIGDLKTVEHWHNQVADIYRRARLGEMPPVIAKQLAGVADIGATLCKALEELKKYDALRETLLSLPGGSELLAQFNMTPFNGAGQDFLPSNIDQGD